MPSLTFSRLVGCFSTDQSLYSGGCGTDQLFSQPSLYVASSPCTFPHSYPYWTAADLVCTDISFLSCSSVLQFNFSKNHETLGVMNGRVCRTLSRLSKLESSNNRATRGPGELVLFYSYPSKKFGGKLQIEKITFRNKISVLSSSTMNRSRP